MKKINFGSFQTRLTLALIAAMFFAAAMSNILIYKYVLNSKLNDLRDKLMAIAQTGALALDADILMQVPLKREGMNTPQYREIAGKLEEIQKANSQIKYIYAITRAQHLRTYPEALSFLAEAGFPEAKSFTVIAPWLPTRTLALVAKKRTSP